MLGLLDLLRAVKGTVTLQLRRSRPVVGGVLVAVLWMGALGAMFALTLDEPSPEPPASSSLAEGRGADVDGPTPISETDDGGAGGDGWDQRSEWTSDDAESTATTHTAATPDGDLGAPADSAPPTRPSSSAPEPSWRTSTTTTTTTTTASSSTTTTTRPPSGGLLGGLIDLLGLGK